MLNIYIARHGETLENKAGIIQGQIDGTLSELGIRQTESLGKRLKGIKFDHIYCSPLGRTRKTLEKIIGNSYPENIEYDPLLQERFMGDLAGTPGNDIDWDHPGIENDETLFSRAGKFFSSLKKKHENGNILLVTHGGWIKGLFCHIHSIGSEEARGMYKTSNCSLSLLKVDNDKIDEVFLNDTSHLLNEDFA